jgi:YHS domain-containing protein
VPHSRSFRPLPLRIANMQRAAWILPLLVDALLVGALASAAPGAALAADNPPPSSPSASPSSPAAQFGGQCAEGLAQGRHVVTNCAINWTDKDGKVYCFSNESSRKAFLENPSENLQKARDFVAASSVDSTEKAMQNFDSGDAETVVKRLIDARTTADNGVFMLEDPLNGAQLKLVFDGLDFTRTIDGYGFFPDAKFHDQSDTQKRYLIDFWVAPAEGALKVQEVRIYKEPVKTDGTWTLTARSPVPWWWIPASEHPGHVANKRGWEVMSAVEQGALAEQSKNNGIFNLKDDKTGKVLALQFIDTHQPIRQLDDNGHYFACTDFRAVGSKDQIYDVDFWITDKDGVMTVEQTRVHKVPELKDGQWVQVPRYDWKDLGNSHVVP